MRVGIVDYRMGNLASVAKAVEAVGHAARVSDSRSELENSDLLVLPGVGNFAAGMHNLTGGNLVDFIVGWIKDDRRLLGICLGMQLLFDWSEEGDTPGLGVVPGKVTRLSASEKIPHMGWNQVQSATSALLEPFVGRFFYFDHSYICEPATDFRGAITNYGSDFVSAIDVGKVIGLQFHPEKSGTDGLSLLEIALEAAA